MKISVLILICLFLAAIFIGQPPVENTKTDSVEINDEQYKLHAEFSERLLVIMQNLVVLIQTDNIDEFTLSEDDLVDMIETAEELLFYAELMSMKVPATELEENEAVIFSAMAGQLYDETLNIKQIAESYDVKLNDTGRNRLLNSAFERLNRTCAACHQLFRDN